jgi:hypothetical protein
VSRQLRFAAGIAAIGLALAGCGEGDTVSEAPPSVPQATASPSATPTAIAATATPPAEATATATPAPATPAPTARRRRHRRSGAPPHMSTKQVKRLLRRKHAQMRANTVDPRSHLIKSKVQGGGGKRPKSVPVDKNGDG